MTQENRKPDVKPDKTVMRALALGGMLGGGGECALDVKNGKVLRIRPFHYDWKYAPEELRPWKIERNGVSFEPLMKSLPGPYSLAYKKRTFSPNRIKYPLKRVDWDPNGAPGSTGPGGRNAQNRGKSKYVRISWDEATDIIAKEINRIHETYGPLGILVQGDGHGECQTIHTPHGHSARLLDMMGGFTQQVRQPDSWEGWYWGSKHVWGQGFQGMLAPHANLLKDISENTELTLFWGCDPETTPGLHRPVRHSYLPVLAPRWHRGRVICPELNYGAPSTPTSGSRCCLTQTPLCSWPSSTPG
jgi:trimethylamine-N-oxide reductase (cytochrome c)